MIVITCRYLENSGFKVVATIYESQIGEEQAVAFCDFMNSNAGPIVYEVHKDVPQLEWNKEMQSANI